MASVRELQQQLLQSHEFIRQLNQEIVTIKADALEVNRKLNYLDGDRQQKEQVIAQLQNTIAQTTAQVAAVNAGGGAGGPSKMHGLVNLKTMTPKKYEGKPEESFKTWAKSVYAYCNAHRTGFRKFLKWCESQAAPIDRNNMAIAWDYKDSA